MFKLFWLLGAVGLLVGFGCNTKSKQVPEYVGVIESISDKPGDFYFAEGKKPVQDFVIRIASGALKGVRVELLVPGIYDERDGRIGDRVHFRSAENLALIRVIWKEQVSGWEIEKTRKP